MNDSIRFLLLVLVNLLLGLLIIFLAASTVFVPQEKLWHPEKLENATGAVKCQEGEKANCTSSQNCTGYRTCRGGQWGGCIIKVICTPGDRTGCFVDSCETGYAVCNACGTAYENCTPA